MLSEMKNLVIWRCLLSSDSEMTAVTNEEMCHLEMMSEIRVLVATRMDEKDRLDIGSSKDQRNC